MVIFSRLNARRHFVRSGHCVFTIKQTADHVITSCSLYQPLKWVHGLTILDDKTNNWLICDSLKSLKVLSEQRRLGKNDQLSTRASAEKFPGEGAMEKPRPRNRTLYFKNTSEISCMKIQRSDPLPPSADAHGYQQSQKCYRFAKAIFYEGGKLIWREI